MSESAIAVGDHVWCEADEVARLGVVREIHHDNVLVRVDMDHNAYLDIWFPLRSLSLVTEH